MRKDRIHIEIPLHFAILLVDEALSFFVDSLPVFAALDGVVQIHHAFFHITVEHVVDLDSGLTSFDDFVRDFM